MVQMARGGAGEYTTPAPAIPRLGRDVYTQFFKINLSGAPGGSVGRTPSPRSRGSGFEIWIGWWRRLYKVLLD